MSGIVAKLALLLVLVLANGVLAGSELALVSLREGQLRRLERGSRAGALVARLARDPSRFLATIQIGITLAGFLASAAAAVALAEPLKGSFGFLGGAAEATAIVLVTLALSYVTLVFGELAPKRIAMQRAEPWALLASRPVAALATATRPAVWLLSRSTDLVVRSFGIDPSSHRDEVTEQELRDLVTSLRSFGAEQRRIIDGAIEISHRTLGQVLRPRQEVFVLAAGERADVAVQALADSGHTRAPVADGADLDHVVGFVHLRDLISQGDRPVGVLAAEVPVFPETRGVLDALRELQGRHLQLAVVIDEHGSVAGIVTVEDLVEEIVGEIYDEADRDVLTARHLDDGSVLVTGRFPVHDLPDIGVHDVPAGPYTTIAGLLLDRLGYLPRSPGVRTEIAGRTFEVTAITGHAISQVRIGPGT